MKRISINAFSIVSAMSILAVLWFPSPGLGGGVVVGWGGNNVGQISLCASNVVSIAAGYEHSLLLKEDGTVAGCGAYVFFDETGHGREISVTVPARLTGVVAVAGGDTHSLALKADGTVVAWGINTDGQGTISFDGQTNVPPDLTNVVAISAGAKHNLALKADGTVVGWGNSVSNVPVGLTNIVAIAAGRGTSLALKADGTVVGWNFGHGADPGNLSNVVAASAGDNCCYESWEAVKADGSVAAGSAFGNTIGAPVLSNVVAISASRGTDHHISLALKADGTVAALPWGYNFYGPPYTPYVPDGLTNVVAVASGDVHNLALIGDAPPVLQALLINPAWDSNGFRVSAPTQSGRVYRLEYKDSLADSSWTPLPLIAGNGGLRALIDPNATGTQRFYRVQRW